MTGKKYFPSDPNEIFGVPVESVIEVPGLHPPYMKNGQLVGGNLDEMSSAVAEEIHKRPWLIKLMEDVGQGKKSAIFKVTLGGLVVLAALGQDMNLE